MIKFENVVAPSPDQWESVIMGARNPMNSWDRSDSGCGCNNGLCYDCYYVDDDWFCVDEHRKYIIGPNDHDLLMRLRNAGTDHRKFMRMLPVIVTITAPLYWWKEFDTYKVGTVSNSCSTMHKIHAKEFTLDDFSHEHLITPKTAPGEYDWTGEYYDVPIVCLNYVIDTLNIYRKKYLETKDKKYWWQMIQLLPSSYNQRRTIMMNFEVLANIYKSRKDHKLSEWVDFCKWIEALPYSELVTGKEI